MPGIGNTTFELNNKTYFFKIGRNNIIDKRKLIILSAKLFIFLTFDQSLLS